MIALAQEFGGQQKTGAGILIFALVTLAILIIARRRG